MKMTKKPNFAKMGWTLKHGSHDFPGPDGGTCINEAAVVACGFEYRKIWGSDDFPPCFSKIIGLFALQLNDSIKDNDLRTKMLMPFVVRIAGTKDVKKNELARARHLFFAMKKLELIDLIESNDNSIYQSGRRSLFEWLDEHVDKDSSASDVKKIIEDFESRPSITLDYLEKITFKEFVRDAQKILKDVNYLDDEIYDVLRDNITAWKSNDPDDVFGRIYFDELRFNFNDEDVVRKLTDALDAAIEMGRHQKMSDFKVIKKRMDEYRALARAREED